MLCGQDCPGSRGRPATRPRDQWGGPVAVKSRGRPKEKRRRPVESGLDALTASTYIALVDLGPIPALSRRELHQYYIILDDFNAKCTYIYRDVIGSKLDFTEIFNGRTLFVMFHER